MQSAASVTTVAHVIQLAVAPVFLLTGVGAILAVLINRLARVVDRFRVLERMLPAAGSGERAVLDVEMAILSRRARLIHWAIGLCTSCALLVCIVIATLFLGYIASANLALIISLLFIMAMFALILGLLCFMREIAQARSTIDVVPR